jgi:integrase
VDVFLTEQAKRYSRNTLRGFRISLSSLFGWGLLCVWIEKNPALGVKLPRAYGGRRVQRRVLTPAEVLAIVAGLPEPYATLVLFLYTTGLRRLSPAGWAFQAGNGSFVNPRNALRRHVLRAARAAGIAGLNWHSFRHSFVVA